MSEDCSSLDGRVAVITGGAGGVGFVIAQDFVAQGAHVVISDLDSKRIEAAVAAIGPRCSGAEANVSDRAGIEAMYQGVLAQHGHLDIVVANAGVGGAAAIGSITEEQFDFIFDTNVKGVVFTVQAALPLLRPGQAS